MVTQSGSVVGEFTEERRSASGFVPSSITTSLFLALVGVAAGSVVVACGVGKWLIYNGHQDLPEQAGMYLHHKVHGSWLIGIGLVVVAVSAYFTVKALKDLIPTQDDCILYGRHIFGLTFAMLVVSLCNATVAATLAIGGDLTFSATEVLEASDRKHALAADERSAAAEATERRLQKEVQLAELDVAVATRKVARVCVASTGPDCESAAEAQRNVSDALARKRLDLDEAHESLWRGRHECEEARGRSRRALFFLLTMSTMTALLGASFYVVNCVRRKRPVFTGDSGGDGSQAFDTDEDDGIADPMASAQSASAGAKQAAAVAKPVQRELFDVHKFWSGAFFRIGEAVLFTFAFFWLIWTSENNEQVIWLPVLALFVGMFVKAGEVVIFSLGTRVLSAVDALLPVGANGSKPPPTTTPPADSRGPDAPSKKRSSSAPSGK
jgi:hypothetical protein